MTTAALMLIGGKLGDIIGRRLAFRIGPRHQVAEKTSKGLAFLPAEVAGGTLREKGVPAPVVTQLETSYSQSQVDALKIAVGGIALIAILGLGVTRRLPASPLRAPPVEAAAA